MVYEAAHKCYEALIRCVKHLLGACFIFLPAAKRWSGSIFLFGNGLYPQKFADYRKMLTGSCCSEIVSEKAVKDGRE